ncbi:MAG: sel1 repeat family protein [Candidatus Methanomethylophilaceae archaeon]|nr:sel1 repeat family protein [Candidatus Methanomethylophilaceae archaeon]
MAEAYPELAEIYLCGYGGTADEKRSFEMLRKGQEAGDALSAFRLGCMYSDGIGVERDEKEAVRMFRIAAYKGIPEAQFKMGVVAQENPSESDLPAQEWYRRAAEAGMPAAMVNLATMLYEGKGTGRDLEKAFSLYSEAAELGDGDAMFMAGRMMFEGIGTERNPGKGMELFVRAAAAGNRMAEEFVSEIRRRQNTQIIRIDGADYDIRKNA